MRRSGTPTPTNITEIVEVCGDGIDNNFDGTVDENCEIPEITPANETAPTPETTPVESQECSSTDGSVDNTLSFEGAGSESVECEPPVPPIDSDPHCPAADPPQFKNYNKGIWKFEFRDS